MTLWDLRQAIEQAVPISFLFLVVGGAWLLLFGLMITSIGGDE